MMKRLTSCGAMAFALVLGLASASVQPPRAEPEIHLIPKGYVGWVTIAFRAANGQAAAYEGDARLYRIPSNGILITKAAPNEGDSPACEFFFEDPEHIRTPILEFWTTTVHDTEANRVDPSVGIAYQSSGRLRAEKMSCDIEFDNYFVGTKAQLLAAGDEHQLAMSAFLAANYRC